MINTSFFQSLTCVYIWLMYFPTLDDVDQKVLYSVGKVVVIMLMVLVAILHYAVYTVWDCDF